MQDLIIEIQTHSKRGFYLGHKKGDVKLNIYNLITSKNEDFIRVFNYLGSAVL